MPPDDPALMTAETLIGHYRRRKRRARSRCSKAVMERIEAANPLLNAFAVINPNALAAAGESERRWNAGRPAGLLDGVPCTVKDRSTSPDFRGSRVTGSDPVTEDAPLVVGLRSEGAVLIGKTTTTELGWKTPVCPAPHHPQPLEPGLLHRRLLIRRRGGGRRGGGRRLLRPAARGHRWRRLNPHPGSLVRAGRPQAQLRPRAAMACGSFCQRLLRRTNDPLRARCRPDAIRHGPH